MSQEIDYFFAALDSHLRSGLLPEEALKKAVEDYAFVFSVTDERAPVAKAAELEFRRLRGEERNDERSACAAEEAMLELASIGGAWVSSAECSENEITNARVTGRWLQIGSFGFVLRTREWLHSVTDHHRKQGLVP